MATGLQVTGFNNKTAENLLLDAGAIYRNFDKTLMTGTLVSASQGGNTFTAKPNMRNIKVDGVKSDYVKGLTVIDSWEISLATNLLEVTKDTLAMALGVVTTTSHDESYDSIKGSNYILPTSYMENIAFVGKLSGSLSPIIIILYNALSTEGLSLNMKDAAEGVIPTTFYAHLDSTSLDSPPFEILYPKPVVTP